MFGAYDQVVIWQEPQRSAYVMMSFGCTLTYISTSSGKKISLFRTIVLSYLFGNFSKTSDTLLKVGEHHRAVFLILWHGSNLHRHLCDHAQGPCWKSQRLFKGAKRRKSEPVIYMNFFFCVCVFQGSGKCPGGPCGDLCLTFHWEGSGFLLG